jgi:hypothetical protein
MALIVMPVSIASADSPSVDDIKVYQGYKETDDWLVVAVYNISGTNTSTSNCSLVYSWTAQLIRNSDSTIVGNWPIEQCGMRPIGLYLSAAMGAVETYGGNYSVKIIGTWGGYPSATRLINASDWKGNINYIDNWVRWQANVIGTFDGEDYLTSTADYGYVLTTDGGIIFDTGIDSLRSYRPDIFQLTTETIPINYENSSQDTTYSDDLYDNWDTAVGPEVSTALTDAGFYFGLDGRLMGALLTIMGFISLAIIEKSVAFMIIIGGVLIGFFPMGTILLLVFLVLIILVRSLFWSST